MKRVAITSGDLDGIGAEVTAKALRYLGPQKNVSFVVFRGPKANHFFSGRGFPFKRKICLSLKEALELDPKSGELIEVVGNHPVDWVEASAIACLDGQMQGLVTGPLSKTLIYQSGRRDLGHTEILARRSGKPRISQGYLGSKFHVLLATAHLPLKKVTQELTPKTIHEAIRAAQILQSCMRPSEQKKPIAILGINPHAGERGLIGTEERIIEKAIRSLPDVLLDGPLVPDAAFLPKNWKKYSVFIASYHDQGLIPFKMIHGQSGGAQISLGLPFVRTSVDHGTAKEIAGKNLANPGSMQDAIRWCLRVRKGF